MGGVYKAHIFLLFFQGGAKVFFNVGIGGVSWMARFGGPNPSNLLSFDVMRGALQHIECNGSCINGS